MIDNLILEIQKKENPTVVGLDPRLSFIPEFIKEPIYEKYGKTPKAVGEIFFVFNKYIIDEIYDLVPAIKPQIAMYEQFGYEGIKSYMRTIEYAKQKGLIVIGDIKRVDITSTAEAYANGHIGRVDIEGEELEIFKEDFVTLSPYLGIDGIEPYLKNCKEYNKGIFILVKTSNPNSHETQNLILKEGELLYEKIAKLVEFWGKELIGKNGYSKVGAVVGATHPEDAKKIRSIIPNTFFLVPGYGAQGASAKDLKGYFNEDKTGAIINSSRGIIAAYTKEPYKSKYKEEEFFKASREAVIDMKNDLNTIFE